MKKIYILVLFVFAIVSLEAQVNVIFRTDMTNYPLEDDQILQIGSDVVNNWTPADSPLTQVDNSQLYEISVEIEPGSMVSYKFTIDEWTTNEFAGDLLPEDTSCATDDGSGNFNRMYMVPANAESGSTIYVDTYEFSSCVLSSLVSNISDLNSIGHVEIAPNPVSTSFVISFDNIQSKSYDVLITNIAGQTVDAFKDVRGNNLEVEASNYDNGIYFVIFRDENGKIGTNKIVIFR